MKRLHLAALAAACLTLAACQSFSLEEYANAANTLDPDCGKKVDLELTPVIMGFWVIPVIGGSYHKSCHKEQFDGAAAPTPRPILGAPVAGEPST